MRFRLIFLLVILVTVSSCKKEATRWVSSWTLPVIKDTLTFANWIDSGFVNVNADQSLQLTYSRELFSFAINEYVQIPDTTVVQNFSIPVPSIFAAPGANFVNDVDEFTLDLDDVELKEIVVASGNASVEIKNPLTIPAIFNITLPGVEKNGVVFQTTEIVPPTLNGNVGSKLFTLDFAGYTLNLSGEQGNSFNKLQSIMQVSSSPDGASTQITSSDVFTFTFSLNDIQLNYARGYFGNISVDDIENLDLSFLNSVTSGSIDVDNVAIDLIVKNGIKAVGQAKINAISSFNANQNTTVSLISPEIGITKNINPASGSWSTLIPSTTDYSFTSLNSNIELFIENLASNYTVDYALELNPFGNTSGGFDEIFSNSKLALNLEATMPLQIGVNQLTLVDTINVNFDQRTEQVKVVNGQIRVETQNSFPFSGTLVLELLDENNSVLTTLMSEENITEAYTTTANVTPIPLIKNSLLYDLSSTQIALLKKTKKVKFTATFDAASTHVQTIYASSQLIIDLFTNFDVQANL